MIICICHNIDESKIKDLAKEELNSEQIFDKLGIGKSCATCVKVAKDSIKEILENKEIK